MAEIQSLHALQTKLDKLFHKGLEDYQQGLSRFSHGQPKPQTGSTIDREWAARDLGWLAGQEIAQIKSQWIQKARNLIN